MSGQTFRLDAGHPPKARIQSFAAAPSARTSFCHSAYISTWTAVCVAATCASTKARGICVHASLPNMRQFAVGHSQRCVAGPIGAPLLHDGALAAVSSADLQAEIARENSSIVGVDNLTRRPWASDRSTIAWLGGTTPSSEFSAQHARSAPILQ
jgi:hypothetical protein